MLLAQELSESESKRASERDRKAEAEAEKQQEMQRAKEEKGEQKKKGLSGDIGATDSWERIDSDSAPFRRGSPDSPLSSTQRRSLHILPAQSSHCTVPMGREGGHRPAQSLAGPATTRPQGA